MCIEKLDSVGFFSICIFFVYELIKIDCFNLQIQVWMTTYIQNYVARLYCVPSLVYLAHLDLVHLRWSRAAI